MLHATPLYFLLLATPLEVCPIGIPSHVMSIDFVRVAQRLKGKPHGHLADRGIPRGQHVLIKRHLGNNSALRLFEKLLVDNVQ